jgi:hypothetical protein
MHSVNAVQDTHLQVLGETSLQNEGLDAVGFSGTVGFGDDVSGGNEGHDALRIDYRKKKKKKKKRE